MERIKELWGQLEGNASAIHGLFKKRYKETSPCDVYLGIKYPENYRLLILRTPYKIGKEFSFKYEFRGLKFEKVYDPDNKEYLLLNLVLVDKQFKDVFDSLIEDILRNIINEADIKLVLKGFANRLIKWQSLFERYNQNGLTSEEQRGLFGELFLLHKLLKSKNDFTNIINSWVGCEGQIRDFQTGSWSIEVKTTHGNNHQKVHISSERQLDTSNLKHLFLYHLSLEVRQKSGETLNGIVDRINEIINSDFANLNRFKGKLVEGGYLDHHRQLYEDVGFYIRQEAFYKVGDEFPRIEESDIRSGIGDVKYSIILSNCFSYLLTEEEIFKSISFT